MPECRVSPSDEVDHRAGGVERVATYTDVLASLRVRSCRYLIAVVRRIMILSERNTDGDPGTAWKPAVEQVISVIDVIDVNVVGFIPVVSPVFWIRLNRAEPIATVLETRRSGHHQEGEAEDAEPMVAAIVGVEVVVRNAVAVVAAALLPGAMLGVEAAGAMLLPCTMLFLLPDMLLFRRAP